MSQPSQPFAIDRQDRRIQSFEALQRGGMFDAEPRNAAGLGLSSTKQGPVERLGRTRGEEDAPTLRQQRRDLIARDLDRGRGGAAGLVGARGVGEAIPLARAFQPAQHRRARLGGERGRGLVIEVDHARHLPLNPVRVERSIVVAPAKAGAARYLCSEAVC